MTTSKARLPKQPAALWCVTVWLRHAVMHSVMSTVNVFVKMHFLNNFKVSPNEMFPTDDCVDYISLYGSIYIYL